MGPEIHRSECLCRTLVDETQNAAQLRQTLMEVQDRWAQVAGATPCPLNFTEEERRQDLREATLWKDREDWVQWLVDALGISHDGWVPHERFEDAKKANALVRKGFREKATEADFPSKEEMYANWPFTDGSILPYL